MAKAAGILIAAIALHGAALAQPFGIAARAPNTSLLIEDLGPVAPNEMLLERAFPRLSFVEPIFIGESPDDSGRMFVAERGGRILTFPRTPDPMQAQLSTFIDLTSSTTTQGEQGVLGMAFDPDFAQNGVFYVSYSWSGSAPAPGATRLSRFIAAPGGSAALASEQVLLHVPKGWTVHCGGMIGFGQDNMLYMSFGDDVNPGSLRIHGQDTTSLHGTIIRIDVRSPPDPGLDYRIPTDNPFYFGGPAGGATRREIFAYGLRNPWRFSFDPATGRMLCGDVGEVSFEEINLIARGGNYGWPAMEGDQCRDAVACDSTGMTAPLHSFGRELAGAIIGGCVYEGTAVPELRGMYLFGDYPSGRLFGFRADPIGSGPAVALSVATGRSITSFGKDRNGEVYITVFGGEIFVPRPVGPASSTFPERLSDIPSLLAAGLGLDQTLLGIYPYEPAAPLWSDGMTKTRFIAIPGTGRIQRTETDGWGFPDKTVLIKNFAMPADERNPLSALRRVETRILYRRRGQWNGFSYEWNDAGTDAVLLADAKVKNIPYIDGDGQSRTLSHLFPSRSQCMRCHTPAAGGVLGLTTVQMNHAFAYPLSGVADNQLRTLDHIGLFSVPAPSPASLPAMPRHGDENAPLRDRVRANLAANCSMCHRPNGGPASYLDLRWETTDAEMNAIESAPSRGDLGIEGAKLIAIGDPGRSVLYERDRRRDGVSQMPPLATSRPDAAALALLESYIRSLELPSAAPHASWMVYP